MIQHSHDYRPGHTYLAGQQKPEQLKAALVSQEDAWDKYQSMVDELGQTGYVENDLLILGRLLDNARAADVEVDKQYKLWDDIQRATKWLC